jgi:MscS family membrane protein
MSTFDSWNLASSLRATAMACLAPWTFASLSWVSLPVQAQAQKRAIADVAHQLPPVFHGVLFGVEVWQYLALFIVFSLALVIRKVIAFVIAHRISSLAQRLGQAWASHVIAATASPGATIVMALMLRLVYPAIALPEHAAHAMAVRVLVVLSIVWTSYHLVDVLAARLAKRAEETESKLDDQLVPMVRRLLKIIVMLAGGVFILQNLEIDVGSLLAGLGIGGLAFALAAKDTIANFFGSVMIFVDKPFQIGDWVRMGDVEGIVEEVGFRSTRVRTFYNSVITIPNAKFTESEIDNYGMRQYRRVFVTLNLTYDTTPEQMQAFVEGVRAILQTNSFTRKDYYEVHMSGFGAHSLDVMVYFFLKVDGWSSELREKHRLFLEIMRLAKSLRVNFAFPTQTLLIDYVHAPGLARDIPRPLPEPAMAEAVRAFAPGGEHGRPRGPRLTHGYYATPQAAGESTPEPDRESYEQQAS